MATIKTYNSLEDRPTEKPKLRDYLPKTEFNLPGRFGKKDSIPEKDILKAVLFVLNNNFMFVRRVQVTGQLRGNILTKSTLTGMPDIIAIKHGIFYGLEVKAKGGKISRVQLECLKEMQINGARVAIVTDSRDLEKIFKGEVCDEYIEGVGII